MLILCSVLAKGLLAAIPHKTHLGLSGAFIDVGGGVEGQILDLEILRLCFSSE